MKKILIGILIVIIGLAGFMVVYMIMYSQGVIEAFNAGIENSQDKLLIASQGSEYKELFVKKVIEKLQDDSLSIKIVDVTTIENENIDEFKAVLIINSIEMMDMNENAKNFISEEGKNKIIILATSGNGEMGPEDKTLDAVTSASKVETIDAKVDEVVTKLKPLL